jgi:hypothetical protein
MDTLDAAALVALANRKRARQDQAPFELVVTSEEAAA